MSRAAFVIRCGAMVRLAFQGVLIDRGRTAMSRTSLSRPMQHAFDDGLLEGAGVFDFGCGRGDDVRFLSALGIETAGWDPWHRSKAKIEPASVVNIGYVINVIEDPDERKETLRRAWELSEHVLVVSGRLTWEMDEQPAKRFQDGFVTSTGSFQKFYTHEELKAWVEHVLGVPTVTAAPGILYVFRDAAKAQQFLARQIRGSATQRRGIAELLVQRHEEILTPLREYVSEHRRLPSPHELSTTKEILEVFDSLRTAFVVLRQASQHGLWSDVDVGTRKTSRARFEEHLDDLQVLIDFVSDRGRLPRAGELSNEKILKAKFTSVRAAFSLVRRVTGPGPWEDFEATARDSFLVYAAVAAFGGRPKMSELSIDMQYDAKDLFGSYSAACREADDLLHQIADQDAINAACEKAEFGKLTPEALYVHIDYIRRLSPLLRVYEGAARQITGNIDDATVVKLNRVKPQVSFLVYPTFRSDPHPALEASIVAKLGEIRMKHRYFGESRNPPILHRKETFIPSDDPDWAKFRRLTAQEERADILDRPDIGSQEGWKALLSERGLALHGHQLRRL